MPDVALMNVSNALADAAETAGTAVVQVRGRRQPASGVVYAADTVLTTTRAVGGEDALSVRTPDGRHLDAELGGWDPATHLVLLRVPGLDVPAAMVAGTAARVGHLAVAVGRSWSNALTASVGNVAVIGGPLATGRGHSIDQIIRTSAPMHRGFAGGALADVTGQLLGIATAARIRGLGVVIPAAIAWSAAAHLLEHGHARRGYLGVACQRVSLSTAQKSDGEADAVVVVHVMDDSPAARAGLMVGDLITRLDDVEISSPEGLLEALSGRGGRDVVLRVLRGLAASEIRVQIGEGRPSRG